MPGHRIDPALVLGATQLLDQVLRQADRELLRCGHTLVIPVGHRRLNLIGTVRGVGLVTVSSTDRRARWRRCEHRRFNLTSTVGGT